MLVQDAVDNLKLKAIKDFDKLVHKLEMGYRPNYDNLLNIICFIDSGIQNNFIASALLNGK